MQLQPGVQRRIRHKTNPTSSPSLTPKYRSIKGWPVP
jgi:hypothetical protein